MIDDKQLFYVININKLEIQKIEIYNNVLKKKLSLVNKKDFKMYE